MKPLPKGRSVHRGLRGASLSGTARERRAQPRAKHRARDAGDGASSPPPPCFFLRTASGRCPRYPARPSFRGRSFPARGAGFDFPARGAGFDLGSKFRPRANVRGRIWRVCVNGVPRASAQARDPGSRKLRAGPRLARCFASLGRGTFLPSRAMTSAWNKFLAVPR
jgi:hypothetical protein